IERAMRRGPAFEAPDGLCFFRGHQAVRPSHMARVEGVDFEIVDTLRTAGLRPRARSRAGPGRRTAPDGDRTPAVTGSRGEVAVALPEAQGWSRVARTGQRRGRVRGSVHT